jgi:hypothetical protein
MSESQLSTVTETSIVTLTGAATIRVHDLLQQENVPGAGPARICGCRWMLRTSVWHDARR